mmetsp:Transcript_38152/g.113022  ORF Transcript_38152/g.113022 Transcript_38152/m.113022 type:complete len:240 (+) Transcript_38152:466-1185(+)
MPRSTCLRAALSWWRRLRNVAVTASPGRSPTPSSMPVRAAWSWWPRLRQQLARRSWQRGQSKRWTRTQPRRRRRRRRVGGRDNVGGACIGHGEKRRRWWRVGVWGVTNLDVNVAAAAVAARRCGEILPLSLLRCISGTGLASVACAGRCAAPDGALPVWARPWDWRHRVGSPAFTDASMEEAMGAALPGRAGRRGWLSTFASLTMALGSAPEAAVCMDPATLDTRCTCGGTTRRCPAPA